MGKKFEQLTITDAYMLGKVLENQKIARRLLEKLIHKKIRYTVSHKRNIVRRHNGMQGIYVEAHLAEQEERILGIRIYLCEGDIFGLGRNVYRFANRCEEIPELLLEEGVLTIFICAAEKEEEEKSEDIRAFLRYLARVDAGKNNFIRMIEEEIHRVKSNPLFKKEYLEIQREETEQKQRAYAQMLIKKK